MRIRWRRHAAVSQTTRTLRPRFPGRLTLDRLTLAAEPGARCLTALHAGRRTHELGADPVLNVNLEPENELLGITPAMAAGLD